MNRKNLWRYLIGLLIILPVLVAFHYWRLPNGLLHLDFLNVGQGDAILVTAPDGEQLLIDGGPSEMKILEELNAVMPFLDRKIDYLLLTHPDTDHVSGLVEVIKRYEVKEVFLTGIESQNNYYLEFLKLIKDKNIPVQITTADSDFDLSDVKIDVLYPFHKLIGEKITDTNNTSIVFKISFGIFCALMTGDLPKEAEKELIKNNKDLHCEVLKMAHHGSKNSTSTEFLKQVSPKYAVISAGKNNSFGHPHKEILEKLILNGVSILRTDIQGRVEISVDGGGKIKIK